MYHTADRPLLIEMIRSSSDRFTKRTKKANKFGEVPGNDPGKHLFDISTANQLMELEVNTPLPKMLFGEFWYEGELCILFADSNAGKSVLAVQIGNSLATRKPIAAFEIQVEQANVCYIDFELSRKQFQSRYTHQEVTYQFGKGFYRAGFNPDADMPPDFKAYDEYMNSAIEYAVKKTGADVLIIDNITFLRSGTERAAEALPLMKYLKALKTRYKLSILVLAHTPKRNPVKPITRNDLQGSKMLINFADSAFAIGESSRDAGLRYLKQVKQRSTQEVYGSDNVCLCHITRPLNFLMFEFTGFANERAHLLPPSAQHRELVTSKVNELSANGLSQRQISEKLNIGLATVNKMLKAGKV